MIIQTNSVAENPEHRAGYRQEGIWQVILAIMKTTGGSIQIQRLQGDNPHLVN